jgi:hypothetical protein
MDLHLHAPARRRRYFILVSDPRELRYFDGEKLKGTIDMGAYAIAGWLAGSSMSLHTPS